MPPINKHNRLVGNALNTCEWTAHDYNPELWHRELLWFTIHRSSCRLF